MATGVQARAFTDLAVAIVRRNQRDASASLFFGGKLGADSVGRWWFDCLEANEIQQDQSMWQACAATQKCVFSEEELEPPAPDRVQPHQGCHHRRGEIPRVSTLLGCSREPGKARYFCWYQKLSVLGRSSSSARYFRANSRSFQLRRIRFICETGAP